MAVVDIDDGAQVYRVRTYNDELVKEVEIPSEPPYYTAIEPCGGLGYVETELVPKDKAEEFQSLVSMHLSSSMGSRGVQAHSVSQLKPHSLTVFGCF